MKILLSLILILIIQFIYIICDCDLSCRNCTGHGYGECTECNIDYYPLEDRPSYCRKEEEAIEDGYYLDVSVLRPCDHKCKKCENSNKCNICRDSYFKSGDECLTGCPEESFRLDFNCFSKCADAGPGYYSVLSSKTCETICPSGTKKDDTQQICIIERTSEYIQDDCELIIANVTEKRMNFFISSNSLIKGKNCFIQVYNAKDQNIIHKVAEKNYISKLFLNSEYNNPNIIVIKIDYNQTYNLQPEVNDVKFYLYDKISDEVYNRIIDLDLITEIDSEDLIYIEKPFIYTENIKLFQSKFEVFDIFNARNEIYNNACIPFTSEYGTDVTYDFRREIYFFNLSNYCQHDSIIYYSSFNAETISIQCKANYLENVFIEDLIGDSRFKVFNCRKYIFSNFINYMGFWIILLIFLFNIGIAVPFIINCFSGIRSFMRIFERGYNKPTGLRLKWTVLNPPKKNIKVIYKPKEFILSDDFFREENELKLKYNLNRRKMNNKKPKNENERITNIGKNKNKEIYNGKSSLSSSNNIQANDTNSINTNSNKSNSNNTNSNNDNLYSYEESTSKIEKRKKEEEERIRKENEKFKEAWSLKEKRQNAKMQYKSCIVPHPEMKSIFKDYTKKQNKMLEDRPINTNLLKLDHIGNVIKSLPINTLKGKYDPNDYLHEYMLHNYDHLLPIPKSERVSSGSLSSDIRNELLKLQQLREKEMVERILFKKIIANQKLLKGYNEDFYPFTFDECIIRRKQDVTYKIIFWNYLREVNLIVNVLYDENYLDIRYLKIYLLGLSLYCMIFFNLLFYSDEYINDFYIHKGKYNFFFQITKSIYSSLCTFIVVKLMSLLVSSKDRLRKAIIKRQYESDKDYIRHYKILLIILLIKIIIFFLIYICFLLFGWFYYCCFAQPYRHSEKFVIVGTIFSFLIYELLSLGVIAMVSGFKYSSIKSQSRKLYQIMSIVNKIL